MKTKNPFLHTAWSDEQAHLFIGRKKELLFLKSAFSKPRGMVVIEGSAGIGKTALVQQFMRTQKKMFPGGIVHEYAYTEDSYRSILAEWLRLPIGHSMLLVVDEASNLTPRGATEIKYLQERNPKLSVLLVGRRNVGLDFHNASRLELNGLTQEEFVELLKRRLLVVSPADARKFYALVSGHPLATELAASSIRSGLLTLHQMYQAVNPFEHYGIVGPDGRPLRSSVEPPRQLVIQVAAVNDELLKLLKADPERLRKVSPRKFEEIVAELLSRQGYTVELTPATRDGGFDMYAAKSDGLGSFLYLVECKRYTPPSKVGVQVVRSLYGCVQQSKATAGLIATTSFFTSDAKDFQGEIKHQISLRDFFEIKKWLRGAFAEERRGRERRCGPVATREFARAAVAPQKGVPQTETSQH